MAGSSKALNFYLSAIYGNSFCSVSVCINTIMHLRKCSVPAAWCVSWLSSHAHSFVLGASGFLWGLYSSSFKAWDEKTLKAKYNEQEAAWCLQWQDRHFDYFGFLTTGHVSCPCNQACDLRVVQWTGKSRKQFKELWKAMKYVKIGNFWAT